MNKISLPPACPENEKIAKLQGENKTIGDFLEWLFDEYTLCSWDKVYERYESNNKGVEKLLADYYGIDLDKVEQEKIALLKWIRESNQ